MNDRPPRPGSSNCSVSSDAPDPIDLEGYAYYTDKLRTGELLVPFTNSRNTINFLTNSGP